MKKLLTILVSFIAFGSCLSNEIKAQTLSVDYLKCLNKQDVTGYDNIYFKYRINGGEYQRFPASGTLSFAPGSERISVFALSVYKNDAIRIELWEEDALDPDDKIDEITINVRKSESQSVYFCESSDSMFAGNAKYLMIYKLEVPLFSSSR